MAKKIGGSILLEGASKYNSDLKSIKNGLAEVRSEMKLVNTQNASSANSIETLSKKHELYAKEIDLVAKRVKAHADALEDAKKKQSDAAANIDKYAKELEEAKSALSEMEKAGKASNEEIEAQKNAIKDLSGNLDKANADYEKAGQSIQKYTTYGNNAQTELAKLNNELTQNDKYLEEAKNSTDGCAKSIDQYGNEVEDAGKKTSEFGQLVKSAITAEAIIKGIETISRGIKNAAEAAIDMGSAFEASMSKVAAISGATGQELDALTAKAKEMGATTMFSATESADAFSYMAMAGWEAEDMLAGIEPIMSLAAASGSELATVSDIVTDDLTALGMSASDAARLADVFAAASANANTNVELMGETFKYAAPVAGALGYSIEDLALATGLMANSGIKASTAGTSLRSWMSRMAAPTNQVSAAMEKLGISLTDDEGRMYSMREIMEKTREAMAGLSETEKTAAASAIAGKNAMSGMLAVVNASDEDFNKLAEAIDNSNGAAKEMADIMQDNLKGKVTILKSALEGLGIAVYDVFSGDMKEGVESATDAVDRLHDAVENGDLGVSLHRMSESLGEFIENAVDLGEEVLPIMIDGLTWLLDHGEAVGGAIAGIMAGDLISKAVVSWNAFKIATDGATVSQWLLNAAMEANPVGILITGVAALTGALIGLELATSRQTDEYDRQLEEAKALCDENEKLNQSIKDSAEAREKAREGYDREEQTAKTLVDELDKLQQKTSLTASEQARQQMIIDELNGAFPELNLNIEENTGKTNLSTDAILKNIDALTEQAKLEAAREDLVNIAKEQYEAEKSLAEIEKERNEALKEQSEATKLARDELEKYGRISDETQEKCTLASESIAGYNERIADTKDTIAELGEEYEFTSQYIEETTEAFSGLADAAAEGTNGAAESLRELSEEEAKLLEDTIGTVTEIGGLFEQMATEAETSMADVAKNLEHNADAMNNYADNIHKAMQIADEAEGETGDATKAVVNYLIGMGTDGAAELDAFVKEAEAKSDTYNDILSNFGDFEQAKLEAERALEDWNAGVNDGWDEVILTTEKKSDEMAEAQQEGFDTMQEQAETHKEEAIALAEETQDEIADAIIGKQDVVTEAAETVTQAAVDQTATTLGVEGGTSSVFYDFGITITQSLAQGISDGTSAVATAIEGLCASAVSSVDISGITERIDQAIAAGAERSAVVYG